jgi:hypothetical protein
MDSSACTILIIAGFFGFITGAIAQNKGRNAFVWAIFGFLLFIVALPLILVLPPDTAAIESKQLRSGNARKCPSCSELVKVQAVVCKHCGRDLPAARRPSTLQTAKAQSGKEYYSNLATKVQVTDRLLAVQGRSWQISQLQHPVRLEERESRRGSKFYIRLIDKAGNLLGEIESGNETRSQEVVSAINSAIFDRSHT